MEKKYFRHRIENLIDVKELRALEYVDFKGKYVNNIDCHPFWELGFLESGKGKLNINGNFSELKKDEVWLIAPNENHYYMAENDKCKIFVICFECQSFPISILQEYHALLSKNNKIHILQMIEEAKNSFQLISDIALKPLKNSNLGGQQTIILQLELILISLLRIATSIDSGKFVFLNNNDFYITIIHDIIDYLKESVRCKLSLEDICKKVHYSKSYICKAFKEQTGQTLFNFFSKLKITDAQKLLIETDKSISEIADSLSFSDPKYFINTFKKITGHTPAQYRKAIKI